MKLTQRFKPRAEACVLSQLVQTAWTEYQDRIASPERQAEVAEQIAVYFENLIPPADFEVLQRYNCVAWHDHCNVRVYDDQTEDVAKYREAFGINLPRKIPVLGTGGYGYPSLVACEPACMRGEPEERTTKRAQSPLRDLDPYFLSLLTASKQYQAEYKASTSWPHEYGKEHGKYPTWEEIAERFPVLGNYLRAIEKRFPL
jgi:hypothetical protein